MARAMNILLLTAVLFFTLALSGQNVPVEATPRRVVSLYPGHTDNVVALGAESLLVAVSVNDDAELPPHLLRLPFKVGAERIVALTPDIVLMRGLVERANPNLVEVLRQAGIEVCVMEPPAWDDFPGYLARLAEILGLPPDDALERYAAVLDLVRLRARELSRGGEKRAVFLEATSRELHTCSPDSWAARLIELAGGRNAASSAQPIRKGSSLAPWGVERALKIAPEVDVYLLQQGAMNATTPEELKKRPWFAAFARARVAVLPEGLLSRPSLLGLKKGGILLAELLAE